jgi:hypothetical protein
MPLLNVLVFTFVAFIALLMTAGAVYTWMERRGRRPGR